MRRLLILFALFAASLAGQAPVGAQQRVAFTAARVNLRSSPGTYARALTTIPRGAALRSGACNNGWCAVTYGTTAGYIAERFIAHERPSSPAQLTGKGYTNSDGVHVRSPVRSPTGPPVGASAQCRDGTYSFSAHRRGTCSHHGGVSRWL
jgi:uncharacterized protein YraI